MTHSDKLSFFMALHNKQSSEVKLNSASSDFENLRCENKHPLHKKLKGSSFIKLSYWFSIKH